MKGLVYQDESWQIFCAFKSDFHIIWPCRPTHNSMKYWTEPRKLFWRKKGTAHHKKWHNFFRWFLLNLTLQCCSPDILKRFVINFMSVSEIDSPILTIVVNRPFRLRGLSHTSSTLSQHKGVLAVLRSSRKTHVYGCSLSVRADSMSRLGTGARHRAIGMIQSGTPQRDIALRFGVRKTISSLWRRFQTTWRVPSDRPRSGRPCVT